jgi:maleate isomerase
MDDVQTEIIKNYKGIRIEIGDGMERHLRVETNTDIANIDAVVLDRLVGDVVGGCADTRLFVRTSLRHRG